MIDQKPEAAERRQGLGARPLGQSPMLIGSGAKAREDFLVEDRGRDPRRAGIDDETDRVRPDVDDRYGLGCLQT